MSVGSLQRSLIGLLLLRKVLPRFRPRQRHAQILGEGLNCSEIEVAVFTTRQPSKLGLPTIFAMGAPAH